MSGTPSIIQLTGRDFVHYSVSKKKPITLSIVAPGHVYAFLQKIMWDNTNRDIDMCG